MRLSVFGISQNLAVCAVSAPASGRTIWITLLVVTCLALISQVFKIERHIWIVAIVVIEPRLMVHDLAEFMTTHLTDASVNGLSISYIRIPCPTPRTAFVKLLLCHNFTK